MRLIALDYPAAPQAADALAAVDEELRNQLGPMLIHSKLIISARVSVLKAQLALPADVAPLCTAKSLLLDISIDGPAHAGMASTRFTRDACASLSSLRPAVLVLKALIARHVC